MGRLALFLLGVVAALALFVMAAPATLAQTGGFPNIFQSLFGLTPKPQAAPPPTQNAPLRARAHKPRKRGQDFVSPSAARTPAARGDKAKPSFFISVLGDSLAIMASRGLADAYADKPEFSVTSLARDSSGLTRDDYYDWPKAARDLLASKPKLDVAVVMLGLNDMQPLKTGGETVEALSDKWKAAYAQRVANLVAPFRDAHVPVLWVGLPPMRDDKFNAQMVALNEIIRDNVEQAGGKYVDIWDAFADENGQYSAFGPDVEGQKAKLRADPNGVYFTKAGQRKLASFLEPEIKRLSSDRIKPAQGELVSLPPDIEQEADDINEEIRREMGLQPGAKGARAPLRPLAGPILSLTAMPTSAHGALIDAHGGMAALADDQAHSLRAGETPPPQSGRADDFTWTKPAP
ncbi:MAG TPA: SGNH family hydrolase [Roseiarcus sp.]|nr:SGNH family hydrolase [Roseiarcus sp.]